MVVRVEPHGCQCHDVGVVEDGEGREGGLGEDGPEGGAASRTLGIRRRGRPCEHQHLTTQNHNAVIEGTRGRV